jgi:excisionase family DNA binding protein
MNPQKVSQTNPQFISRVHAAKMLDCNVQLVDRLVKEGRLPVVRLGRKILIRQEVLLQLLESGELE